MICPKCKSFQVKCIDSRPYLTPIRRRKECVTCGHRFTTIEVTVLAYKKSITQRPIIALDGTVYTQDPDGQGWTASGSVNEGILAGKGLPPLRTK